MARKTSSHLKLHVDNDSKSDNGANEDQRAAFSIDALTEAFTKATGWSPRPLAVAQVDRDGPSADDEPLLPIRKRIRLVSDAPIDGLLEIDDSETIRFEIKVADSASSKMRTSSSQPFHSRLPKSWPSTKAGRKNSSAC